MKKLLIVVLGLSLFLYQLAQLTPGQTSAYEQWKAQHNLVFTGEEDAYRKNIFFTTLQAINKHNSIPDVTYRKGLNHLSAMSDTQFAHLFLRNTIPPKVNQIKTPVQETQIVGDVDWQAAGVVSPVRDQGNCRADYAFAAIGAVQSYSAILTKNKIQYSVQQIVDCSSGFGNSGCSGGTIEGSYQFVQQRGITTQTAYPYKGAFGSCSIYYGSYKIDGFTRLSDCTSLANALSSRPISVMVSATNWKNYKYGIFSDCTSDLNAAALLVGVSNTYWRVKNSWGVGWGQNGYIRLDKQNNCGVCTAASFPTKSK